MSLARASGQPLTELLTWHPRDVATLVDILDEERAQARRDSKG